MTARFRPGGTPGTRAALATVLLAVLAAWPAGGVAAAGLFQDLGGRPGITRFADRAVDLYMADPRLTAYFDNINPDWLKPRFAAYLCREAGGGCLYRGRAMAAAHKGLQINEAAFNAVVEDLQQAMRESGIAFATQNRLLAHLAPMEREIVTR